MIEQSARQVSSPSPAPDTCSHGLLLMAHGTKDSAGQAELHELWQLMSNTHPLRPVTLGVLEYPSALLPSLDGAGDLLAAIGVQHVAAVPVLLLQAGHGKLDMPQAFARLRARYPHLHWRLAPPLLPHPLLRQVIYERITAASAAPLHGGTDAERLAVLLVGRGTHDSTANAELFRIARLFEEEYGYATVEACFVSQTTPGVSAGIARCVALGARRIIIAPYFLHTGVLVRRITTEAEEAVRSYPGIVATVSAHIGNHPRLLELLLLRAQEARLGLRTPACLAGWEAPEPLLPVLPRNESHAPEAHHHHAGGSHTH
ncbi:MAG: sirohydrochlorin chelatase [Chloroflexi bacterium]|nr:sirohydrochlorin chelatase [Chloroflexota bacterium]